jgi:hypothetical protein
MDGGPERIELTRTGGFANIAMRSCVPASALGLEERAGLDALMTREAAGGAVAGFPDRFQYEVTVVAGEQRHIVLLGEHEVDGSLRALIDRLEQDAQPAPRRGE